MSPALLTLDNIQKSFGNTRVLADVSLQLGQGEILFLVGPSGCGKTTLLRIIAGFEVADLGHMQIGDRLIFDQHHFVPPRDRHLGYVLQEGVLFPHMSVYRNIAYGLGNGKGRTEAERARVHEVMALTDISELAERKPHQISGGQQQRVALARALAPGPSIMLLDEPFSALDEHLRAQIRDDIIDILRRSNSAAIIVTHDRHEALSCADRVGLLDNGHLLQLDTPENIYQRPASPLVARFISDNSLLLPAELDAGACCAQSALAQRVPIEIMSAQGLGQHARTGKLLIRADQLEPTRVGGDGAICSASVQRIKFHGSHSQVDLLAGDTRISLDLTGGVHAQLRIGDTIGLRLVGNGLFYPH
ncbi:MAG: ABC transporter ATP-binding protein [Ottowia sp.]|nr:ABC transporter ATP-binding protein [Ottowia sp.]